MKFNRAISGDPVSTAVWIIAVLGGGLAFLQSLKTYPPYINDDPLSWQLPLVCYVPGLVIAIVFWKKLFYGEPPFPGAKVLGILVWPLALTAVGTSTFLFFNGYLDSSTANTIRYVVLQTRKYDNDYSLDMQSVQGPPILNSITVDEKTYLAARSGSRVAVEVKKGYFNTPWIVAYRFEDPSITSLGSVH